MPQLLHQGNSNFGGRGPVATDLQLVATDLHSSKKTKSYTFIATHNSVIVLADIGGRTGRL